MSLCPTGGARRHNCRVADNTLFAYIDETGDLGGNLANSKTSPIFGFAAVLVTPAAALELCAAIDQLRSDFHVPAQKVMSWKDHVRSNERRMHAVRTLGAVAGVRVLYVYTDKREVTGSYVQARGALYNYVAGKMYKSILWCGRNQRATEVQVRFGQVANFDHNTSREYFRDYIDLESKVPNELVAGLKWVTATQYRESQAADLYAGFLKAAVWPDEFGGVDPRYLQGVWHQVRSGGYGCKIPLGFMSMPSDAVARALPWWSCTCPNC